MEKPQLIKNIFHEDDRGFLMKISPPDESPSLGRPFRDVYVSDSKKNVFRGLHFQNEPYAQEKYFSCIQGEVDLFCILVESSNVIMRFTLAPAIQASLYVPKGWATGFHSKKDSNKLLYASHQRYSPEHEAGLHFERIPLLGNKIFIVSHKDQQWEKHDK